MTLKELYPKEWKELRNKEVPQKEIDEYLIRFMARLLKEVKEGKRNHLNLGDGFGIGVVQAEGSGYKLNPALHDFLITLSDYNIEIDGGIGWGSPQTPDDVETELKKVAKKLGIKLK